MDSNLFINIIQENNSNQFLLDAYKNSFLFSIISILAFNYAQRSYNYKIALAFICLYQLSPYLIQHFKPEFVTYQHQFALSITNYLLLILFFRGLKERIAQGNQNNIETNTHIATYSGAALAALYLITSPYIDGFSHSQLKQVQLPLLTTLLGIIFVLIQFAITPSSKTLLDNIQEIRCTQKLYHLCIQKYFRSTFTFAALTSTALVVSFTFFIHIINIKHADTPKLDVTLPNIIFALALSSILYELFLKKRFFIELNLKLKLSAINIVIVVFTIIQCTNTFQIKVDTNSELYFFIPIFSSLFIFFTFFATINLFYNTLNTLYLPLPENNIRDYYIKSAYLGLASGIGIAFLIIKYLIPRFHFINYTEYSLILLAITLLSTLLIYLNIYRNYKTSLQKKLTDNQLNKIDSFDFFDQIKNKFKKSDTTNSTFLANLLYILNPYYSKQIFESLITNNNDHFQKLGLIYTNQLLLINSYDNINELTKSKYYASSINRDYIDVCIKNFDEIKSKMQKDNYIHQLSISKLHEERFFAALLCEQTNNNSETIEILKRLLKDNDKLVLKHAIISACNNQDIEITKLIVDKLDQPTLSNAAFASLTNTKENELSALEEAFYETGQNEKTQIKITQILGCIANEQAIKYLFPKVNYTNQKVITSALKALSKCQTTLPQNEALIIKHELEEVCRFLIWNSSLILDLKKTDSSESLIKALHSEVSFNYKSLFDLLNLLYSAQSIQLIQENLNSNNYERRAFAIELAAVILKDEVKPIILPLLQPISMQERVKTLQKHFCTENLSKTEALYDIIQRDYKWISPWTKVCALKELSKDKKSEDIPILLANMINPDPLLAEIAAHSIYTIDKDIYNENKRILGKQYLKLINNTTLKIIESPKVTDNIPQLKADIIEYLQSIPRLSEIPGEILKLLTEHVQIKDLPKGTSMHFDITNPDTGFCYIIFSGSLEFYFNNTRTKTHHSKSFISNLDYLPCKGDTIGFTANENTLYYEINHDYLNELIHTFPEVSLSLLNSIEKESGLTHHKKQKNQSKIAHSTFLF